MALGGKGVNIPITAEDKTKAAIKSAQGNMRALDGTVKKLMTGFAAFAGAAGIGALVKGTLDAADNVAKMSDRLGIGVEALQELQYAAERSGIGTSTLNMGLQRLQRRIGEAAAGSKPTIEAFTALGLKAENLAEVPLEEAMLQLGQALSEVGTESQRTALAAKLLDSEGVGLIQMFTEGRTGAEQLMEQVRELGGVMSDEQVQAAVEAQDAITNLNTSIAGLKNSLITDLAPALTEVVETLTDLSKTDFPEYLLKGAVTAASIVAVSTAIRALSVAVATFNTVLSAGFLARIASFVASINPWVAAATAVTVGVIALTSRVKKFREEIQFAEEKTDLFTDSLAGMNEEMLKAARTEAVDTLKFLEMQLDDLHDAAESSRERIVELDEEFRNIDPNQPGATTQILRINEELEEQQHNHEVINRGIAEQNRLLGEQRALVERLNKAGSGDDDDETAPILTNPFEKLPESKDAIKTAAEAYKSLLDDLGKAGKTDTWVDYFVDKMSELANDGRFEDISARWATLMDEPSEAFQEEWERMSEAWTNALGSMSDQQRKMFNLSQWLSREQQLGSSAGLEFMKARSEAIGQLMTSGIFTDPATLVALNIEAATRGASIAEAEVMAYLDFLEQELAGKHPLSEGMGPGTEPPDVVLSAEQEMLGKRLAMWKDNSEQIAGDMGSILTSEMMVTVGKIKKFGNLMGKNYAQSFKRAGDAILDYFLNQIFQKIASYAALSLLNVLAPGGGGLFGSVLGSLFGKSPGAPQLALGSNSFSGGQQTTVYQFQSVLPPTQADLRNAERTVYQTQRSNSRFILAGA